MLEKIIELEEELHKDFIDIIDIYGFELGFIPLGQWDDESDDDIQKFIDGVRQLRLKKKTNTGGRLAKHIIDTTMDALVGRASIITQLSDELYGDKIELIKELIYDKYYRPNPLQGILYKHGLDFGKIKSIVDTYKTLPISSSLSYNMVCNGMAHGKYQSRRRSFYLYSGGFEHPLKSIDEIKTISINRYHPLLWKYLLEGRLEDWIVENIIYFTKYKEKCQINII